MEQQDDAMRTACRLIIIGRVQGVGYRQWMRGEATRLRLSGHVRNRRDGSVEALIVGHPNAVAAMVAASWQGPAFAEVESIAETAADAADTGPFEILQTV